MKSKATRKRGIMDNICLRNLIRFSTSKKTTEFSSPKENAGNMETVPRFYRQCRKKKKIVESQRQRFESRCSKSKVKNEPNVSLVMLGISKSMNDRYMICNEEDMCPADSSATSSNHAVTVHAKPSCTMERVYSQPMTLPKLKPDCDKNINSKSENIERANKRLKYIIIRNNLSIEECE